jgi:hypothetical protein
MSIVCLQAKKGHPPREISEFAIPELKLDEASGECKKMGGITDNAAQPNDALPFRRELEQAEARAQHDDTKGVT